MCTEPAGSIVRITKAGFALALRTFPRRLKSNSAPDPEKAGDSRRPLRLARHALAT
jgi:hypothetical protein